MRERWFHSFAVQVYGFSSLLLVHLGKGSGSGVCKQGANTGRMGKHSLGPHFLRSHSYTLGIHFRQLVTRGAEYFRFRLNSTQVVRIYSSLSSGLLSCPYWTFFRSNTFASWSGELLLWLCGQAVSASGSLEVHSLFSLRINSFITTRQDLTPNFFRAFGDTGVSTERMT